ncbi:hypothetical protein A3D88_02280 [Candidatus Peribacteria bacterium RIFCSPHIGHO2_02_FULL_52_16]|nr:MAG: hypothetical protein A2706_02665 [Candidatus Peribacteria bacterium RIFCSPHIGHO2_01_FULL_51_35]OGJ61448.1 MAG: hypothetical protein A3D88_02280 [Candidatus Peribacteria bacterium RIFCSPHIGHO2_02_FULL_52_16]
MESRQVLPAIILAIGWNNAEELFFDVREGNLSGSIFQILEEIRTVINETSFVTGCGQEALYINRESTQETLNKLGAYIATRVNMLVWIESEDSL